MTIHILFLLVVHLFLSLSDAQGPQVDAECLASFYTNPERFDVCRNKECIIIRDEPPIVFIPPFMKTKEHEQPFRCVDANITLSPKPGAFFDIVNETVPLSNAYCVWAGAGCSFDGELAFLKDAAVKFPQYKFIVGGLLFVLPSRLHPKIIPSVPLAESKLYFIGPPPADHSSPKQAVRKIIETFSVSAWIFIFTCMIGHLIIRGWISWHFTSRSSQSQEDSFCWKQFRARFFDFGVSHAPVNHRSVNSGLEDDNEENWKHMNVSWFLIAKFFIAVVLVLWEVAIAVSVFETTASVQLAKLDAGKFAVENNSTMEHIFRRLMEQNKTRKGWDTYGDVDSVYSALENRTNGVDFTLSYELVNRYKMNENPGMCRKLRLYKLFPRKLVSGNKPPPLAGSIWYSSNINATRRLEINTALVKLKEKGKIEECIDRYAGGDIADRCQSESRRIEWVLIAFLLLVLPGVPFTVFFASMVFFSVRNRLSYAQNKASVEENYYEEEVPESELIPRTTEITASSVSTSNRYPCDSVS